MAKVKLKEHRINTEWCKGCGICVAFCPKQVLALDDKDKVMAAAVENCIACKLCELRCPDLAIEVVTAVATGVNTESVSEAEAPEGGR